MSRNNGRDPKWYRRHGGFGFPSDPIDLHKLAQHVEVVNMQMAANSYTRGPDLLRGRQMGEDPRRSIEDECGYPRKVTDLTAWDYKDMIDSNAVANRANEVKVLESWQVAPELYESDDPAPTPFEEAWQEFGKTMRGGDSHWQDEEGHPVWPYLKEADIESGSGRWAILYFAFNDGLDPSLPVPGWNEDGSVPVEQATDEQGKPVKDERGRTKPKFPGKQPPTANSAGWPRWRFTFNAEVEDVFSPEEPTPEEPFKQPEEGKGKGKLSVMYLQVFPETQAQVMQWEANPTSPRYGLPIMYLVTFNDPRESGGLGMPMASRMVHYSRVIHYNAEKMCGRGVSIPRLRPIWHNLMNVKKIYGASGEGYWKQAQPLLSFQTHPQLGGDVTVDDEKMRDLYERLFNSQQKAFHTEGMSVNSIAPSMVDPTPHFMLEIQIICIKLGIPQRVFLGSERGELASSQDDAAWNDRLKERQSGHITPRIIVPFIDRLILVGILPKPTVREERELPPDADQAEKMALDKAAKGKGEQPAEEQPAEEAPKGNPFGGKPGGPPDANALFGQEEQDGEQDQDAEDLFPPEDDLESDEGISEPEIYESPAGYKIWWPDISSMTDAEKANVALVRTQVWSAYVQGGLDQVMTPEWFAEHFDDMDAREAQAMLQDAEAENLIKEREDMLKQQKLIEQGLVADPEVEQDIRMEQAKTGNPPPFGGPPGGPPKPFGQQEDNPFEKP